MSAHAAPPVRGALRVAGPYVRPQSGRLGFAAGTAVLEIGCQLIAPWPLALAVDHALEGRPLTGTLGFLSALGTTGLLVASGVCLILLTAVAALLGLWTEVLAARAAQRIGGTMRQALFDRTVTLSLRWHDRMRTGEVVSRLTADVNRVTDAVSRTFTNLLPDVLLLAGTLTLMLLIDPGLTWLGLAVVPVIAWLSARQRRRVRAAEMAGRKASGRLSSVAVDLMRNVRAVQAFGRLDQASRLFRQPNDELVAAQLRAEIVGARWAPVMDLVLAAGAGIVLVAGGVRVVRGDLTTGQLLVMMSYFSGLQSPVRGMVRLAGPRAKAFASALRLRDVLDCSEAVTEPAEPRPVPPIRQGLRLEDVRFAYVPHRPVLRDFGLSVAAGESVCLFGPSGAGKSTVLHLLLRLYDPDAGRVLLDGVDVREFATVELRRQVAFVPQDPWLLDGTIAENIAFGHSSATRAEVLAAGR